MTRNINYDTLPMNWIGDFAARRAALTPSREAIYDASEHIRLTFADVNNLVNEVKCGLTNRYAIKQRDVVCFLGRNSAAAIVLQLACAALGVIFAPISYRLTAIEIAGLIKRLTPSLIVVDEEFHQVDIAFTDAKKVYYTDLNHCLSQLGSASDNIEKTALSLSDRMLYIHTGGSTGLPKICIVPYRQMYWNIFEILAFGWGGLNCKELVTFPFFHIGGWNSFLCVFHSGGHCTLTRTFDAETNLHLIDDEAITHFGAVEAMLQLIASHPQFPSANLSSLQHIHTAGAPCASDIMKTFWDRNIPVSQVYGMTEAGPSNFGYLPADPILENCKSHAQTIGTAMSHCDFSIIEQDGRNPVAPESIGILHLRSAHNFAGYLDDPQRTETVLHDDGWVTTGDLAYQDSTGLVYIVGRADNMFISGGENISPEEIEKILLQHPKVKMAICVGVPDRQWGHVPYAQVELHTACVLPEHELHEFCKLHLAPFKIPRTIDTVAAIPLTGSGKLDRVHLRNEFALRPPQNNSNC